MSDEGNRNGSASETSTGPLAGARLKSAREARGLAIESIARELHLDVTKLNELEANRFENLGAPVFIKGYLRKFAGMVGVPEAEVLAEFDALYDAADQPPVVLRPRRERRRYLPGPQVFAIAVLVLVVVAVAWWAFAGAVLKPRSDETASPPPSDAVPTPAPAVTRGEPEPEADTVAPPRPMVAEEPAPAVVAAPSPEPPPERDVALTFDDECWFELTDGDGRRLYSGTGRPGQTRRFSGPAPLSLVLGNAAAVRIEVDGRDWRIDPADRRGRTARVTIPAR